MGDQSVRERFERLLDGREVDQPVYAVYDWFVNNHPTVDWESLFARGLGQIMHANVIRHEHPSFEIETSRRMQGGRERVDTRWITDCGELHEWYLDGWKQEHFIKGPEDYRIMLSALEGVRVLPDADAYDRINQQVGDNGYTVGMLQGLGMGRTPLMVLQIDWVGLEQFSIDLVQETPEMLDLLTVMEDLKLEEFRAVGQTPARQIKLWENLSIETLGPKYYRRFLVPLYERILEILATNGQRLLMHYDGQLRVIADDVAAIDSFTSPPEGDMQVSEARAAWPDKFLWCHVPLGWYREQPDELARRVRQMAVDAGPTRYCMMISEDVPPDWQTTVPCVLEALSG